MEFANFLLGNSSGVRFDNVSVVVFIQKNQMNMFNTCFINSLKDLAAYKKTQTSEIVIQAGNVKLYKGLGTRGGDLLTQWIDEKTDFSAMGGFLESFPILSTVIYMIGDSDDDRIVMGSKFPAPTTYSKHVYYHSDRINRRSRELYGYNDGVDKFTTLIPFIDNGDVLKIVSLTNEILEKKENGFAFGFMTAASNYIARKMNKKRFSTAMPLVDYVNWPGYMSLDASFAKHERTSYGFTGTSAMTFLLNQVITKAMVKKFIADSQDTDVKIRGCDKINHEEVNDTDDSQGGNIDDSSDDNTTENYTKVVSPQSGASSDAAGFDGVEDDFEDDFDEEFDDDFEDESEDDEPPTPAPVDGTPYVYTETETTMLKLLSSAFSVAANLESRVVVRPDGSAIMGRPTQKDGQLVYATGQTVYMKMTTPDIFKFTSNLEMLGYDLF
ncbi:hypothetical protein [Salmon gill poxvirus]|nr:hypothetical protein [Salmon gill poxvirus]